MIDLRRILEWTLIGNSALCAGWLIFAEMLTDLTQQALRAQLRTTSGNALVMSRLLQQRCPQASDLLCLRRAASELLVGASRERVQQVQASSASAATELRLLLVAAASGVVIDMPDGIWRLHRPAPNELDVGIRHATQCSFTMRLDAQSSLVQVNGGRFLCSPTPSFNPP